MFEEFGVRVRDRSRLVGSTVRSVPWVGPGLRVHGWLAPYARLFSGSRRSAMVFAILMIGLIPLNGIGQACSVRTLLHEIGNFSAVGSLLGGSVIWIGALAGSFLAWLTLDRLGRDLVDHGRAHRLRGHLCVVGHRGVRDCMAGAARLPARSGHLVGRIGVLAAAVRARSDRSPRARTGARRAGCNGSASGSTCCSFRTCWFGWDSEPR